MRALSIRQPFAELILRGIKTIEYRSRATKIVGERFFIYASKGQATDASNARANAWSRDLSLADDLPDWMIELAEQVKLIPPGTELPRGVIVGSAVIAKVSPVRSSSTSARPLFEWHLTDVERAATLRKPARHPQPVWFQPF